MKNKAEMKKAFCVQKASHVFPDSGCLLGRSPQEGDQCVYPGKQYEDGDDRVDRLGKDDQKDHKQDYDS